MAGQICIKTVSGTWCSTSPIADCGCKPDTGFRDPYPTLDPALDLDNPANLLRELDRSFSTKGAALAGKSAAILTTVRLMLLAQVPANEPFVVIGLEGMQAHRESAP